MIGLCAYWRRDGTPELLVLPVALAKEAQFRELCRFLAEAHGCRDFKVSVHASREEAEEALEAFYGAQWLEMGAGRLEHF